MASLPENVLQMSKIIPKPEKDLACQNLIKLPGVSRHGFLRKMPDSRSGRLFDSFLNRKWSSKFVVLRNGCVYIYDSEVSLCCDRANSLFGFQDVHECGSEVYKAGKWVFQVVDALLDQDRDRSLFFSANSEDDMRAWIESFQNEIMKGNIMIFDSFSSSTKSRARTAATERKALPTLPEEMREKMRESMNIASNVNFCRETDFSSDEHNSDDEESNTANNNGKSKVLPPVPDGSSLPSNKLPALKADNTAVIAGMPKPQPKPPGSVKPPTVKPVASLPNKQGRELPPIPGGSAPQKPSNQKQTPTADNVTQVVGRTLEQSQSNAAFNAKPKPPSKPTNAVKPLTIQPGSKNEVRPTVQLDERKVPQPPEFTVISKNKPTICNSNQSFDECSGGYEGGSEYLATEYEHWDPRESCMVDPLVKASYWQQDANEALKIMKSVKEDGVFLIRDASDGLDYKTLMVSMSEVDSSVRKYKIIKESNLYSLHLGKSGFKSLHELLQYYKENSLPNRATKLTKPYSHVWKNN